MSPHCHFCRESVSVVDGFLELYSEIDGRLCYPCGFGAVALFTHTSCGPDTGYAIDLKRLKNVERPHGWISQINQKGWSSDVYLQAIRRAAKLPY